MPGKRGNCKCCECEVNVNLNEQNEVYKVMSGRMGLRPVSKKSPFQGVVPYCVFIKSVATYVSVGVLGTSLLFL